MAHSANKYFKPLLKYVVALTNRLISTYLKIRQKFTSLQIRTKLVLVTGLLFIFLTTIFSVFLIQRGTKILNDKLTETCDLSLRHLAQVIKDDLFEYYLPQNINNPDNRTTLIGHIREAVLELNKEEINGLIYASVVDREGNILAHSDMDRINQKISSADSAIVFNLKETLIRENTGVIEYWQPMYVLKESGNPILLGVSVIGFSKSIILKPIKKATQGIILAAILITFLAVIAIYFLARRMTRQVDEMIVGVRNLGKGDLNHQIPVLSRDELGRLAIEFNRMIIHLREKLQMQKFVSKLTVQMIQNGSNNDDMMPVGEKRQATLLFSDVRKFSQMTSQLPPEKIVEIINIYLDLQARIIEENDGIVDKFVGDQVMAIFLGDKQADMAIHTAVEIQRSIRKLNTSREQNGDLILQVGCGLNIGSVVMGNMGSKNRKDYTVIGEVVNLAAGLCAIAKPKQILAPIEMVDQLSGDYPTIRLNPVWVKGRSQPIEVFEVDYFHAIIM